VLGNRRRELSRQSGHARRPLPSLQRRRRGPAGRTINKLGWFLPVRYVTTQAQQSRLGQNIVVRTAGKRESKERTNGDAKVVGLAEGSR